MNDCLFVESERLKIKKECSDDNIDFNLQKLMTHPSLQMPVERLLLSFLVSRDWFTHIFSQFPGAMTPQFDPTWVCFPKPFISQFAASHTAFSGYVAYDRGCIPFHPFIWSLCRPNSVWRGVWFGVHIPGSPRAFTFHCEFKLGKDICDYTLHTFSTCLWTLLFFLHIFIHMCLHVLLVLLIYSLSKGLHCVKKKANCS